MENQPDHTENAPNADTGQGYPEEEPSGSDPREGGDRKSEQGADQPTSPEGSGGRDSDPGAATGNPGAAG